MSFENNEEIITLKPHMAAILNRIQKSRALIAVRFDKHPATFNSMFLEIDSLNSQFTIDELNSIKAHKKLRVGTTLHIEALLKGIYMAFSSEIIAIESSSSIAMYKLSFPVSMIYHQRRRHHRAHIVQDQSMPISMPLPLRYQIRGEVVDISTSGICSRIKITDSNQLEQNQAIHDVTIALPGHNQITCDLEVCSIRHFPEQGYSLIGSQFIDIPPTTRTHLARVVAMLDRHQRRAVV